MKLADSWVDDKPNLVLPAAFHDEVEEHDKVDEGKDGGAVWSGSIGNWIRALKTLGVLKLVEPAIREHQAARYSYVA